MQIKPLQQAECANRCKVTSGPNPGDWITPSLPAGWRLVSYHFFVNWGNEPPTVASRIWMTRQLWLDPGETLDGIRKADVLAAFSASSARQEFEDLERIFAPCGQQVSAILLPEIPMSDINDDTPIWVIIRGYDGEPSVLKFPLRWLKSLIQQYSGGPVKIGDKGLILGTSAVECHLSHTNAAFPGDADAVIVDDQNRIRYLIEYKKHTKKNDPISSHLVTRYYPKPDGRKYQRLEALAAHYRLAQQSAIPLVVLYYSTVKPEIRSQQIIGMNDKHIYINKDNDSGEMPVDNHTSATVVKWLRSL